MADWAVSVNAVYFFDRKSLEMNRVKENKAKLEGLLQVWSRSYHPKLVHTASFLSRLQKDWDSCSICHSMFANPFEDGRRLVFSSLFRYAAEKETETAIGVMSQLSRQLRTSPTGGESPDREISGNNASKGVSSEKKSSAENDTPLECHYLLASAGSGKTQHLIDKLSENYGFYLTSGAISDDHGTGDDAGEAHYQPRTTGSSRDTKLLHDTTNMPWLKSNGVFNASKLLGDRVDKLISCRLCLLGRVIKLSANQSLDFTFNPKIWLQYQLSCQGEQDSFRRLFRLSIIAREPIYLYIPQVQFGQKGFLWCLDEVQCDLSELSSDPHLWIPTIISTPIPIDVITMLESLVRSLARFHGDITTHYFAGSCFLSGTALNIHKVRASVAAVHRFENDLYSEIAPVHEKFDTPFILVTNEQEFNKLFRRRMTGLLDRLLFRLRTPDSQTSFFQSTCSRDAVLLPANPRGFDSSSSLDNFRQYSGGSAGSLSTDDIIQKIELFMNDIRRNSISFRGRHRWSVYYIESLLTRFLQDKGLTSKAIDEVAKAAESTLKKPLKRRVKDLANMPERRAMLKNVFNMAFDADLFGRSRILPLKSGADLIEQALGYVERAESKGVEALQVCLAERMVVDSVMDYLKETGELETLVDDYIHENQFHEGAFGDAAEVALAASILKSQTLPQSENFISAFQTVYKISATGCEFKDDANLANCFLEKGLGLRSDYGLPKSGEMGLTDWLRRVRVGGYRPTFLFPEKVAGPDLMFVFKEREGTRRVVFAIQVCTLCSYISKLIADFVFFIAKNRTSWRCRTEK